RGDLPATPVVNTAFLALGSLLASFVGTTGASMLLIRPLLQTNRERTRVAHTVVFFIFLVSNIGGMLTPLGDPPLFLGYLQGVPFLWTLRLWPAWLFMIATLLVLYVILDGRQFAQEPLAAIRRARALAVLLGERDPVLVPGQRADVPDVPRPRPESAPGPGCRRRPPRDPRGHRRGLGVDGGEFLHRERPQLHGEVHCRGGGGQDAELLRLHALQRAHSRPALPGCHRDVLSLRGTVGASAGDWA